jgi:hypothetical protein
VGGPGFYDDGGVTRIFSWRDVTELHLNTLWASWIFDNPGVDTDGDGFKGFYHIYCTNESISRIDTMIISPEDTIFDTTISCPYGDTLYYRGDGVPDFRGAEPPLAPEFTLNPRIDEFNTGEITIRWNGQKTESTPDQFSQRIDFEGYRIYISRSGLSNDFTMVTSYDMENFDRYDYDAHMGSWLINSIPFTMQALKQMYGEDFDPFLYYDAEHLFMYSAPGDTVVDSFYFARHDWNQSDLFDTTLIHKCFPEQPYPPTLNLDTARMFYPNELTEDGYLKYFEYKYVLKNLIPSVPYYIAVTAFDHGFPAANLTPLETKPVENCAREFAQNSNTVVKDNNLEVIVYPNPYRVDENYRSFYEGWEEPDQTIERTRALHFTNLPHKCVIRIFSIDGDFIDEILHDFDENSPGSMHATWDLISRNKMPIVSGIYYYTVESDYGNQIGKFVVIK